jgi:AAA+ superfamily predicted ATPase
MQLTDLIITDIEKTSSDDLIMDEFSKKIILRLNSEYEYSKELRSYNLLVNNKIILHGSSGCGKTSTAQAIAAAVVKNLLILNLSNVICSRIGETSQNLKMVYIKLPETMLCCFLMSSTRLVKNTIFQWMREHLYKQTN